MFQSSPNRGRGQSLITTATLDWGNSVSVLSKSRKGPELAVELRVRCEAKEFQSSPNRGRGQSPPRKFVMRIKGLQGRLHFVGFAIAILPLFIFEYGSKSRCFVNDFITLHVLHFLHGGMRVSAFSNRKCETVVIRSVFNLISSVRKMRKKPLFRTFHPYI